MQTTSIDTTQIRAMMEQLRAVANRGVNGSDEGAGVHRTQKTLDFADVLRGSLDSVDGAQKSAEALSQRFTLADDSVNLSDVMIATQKANITFQAAVQVRNKLVSAYHDVMQMAV